MQKQPLDKYAEVSWCSVDIRELRPDWSDERCDQFLDEYESHIQSQMIERGWYAIESLLQEEDNE